MAVELKDTFNNVVTMYDAARPKYPAELLQDVMPLGTGKVHTG